MHTPHILLVDDDTALLQALPHMIALRLHGVQVDTADSAEDALRQIRLQDYDAIVTDITMPGMDGLELLAHIQESRPEIPTILITGQVDPRFLIKAMEQGAYDFIHKPIDRVSLVVTLHRAIQTRQLRRQIQEQQQLLISYTHLLAQLGEQNPDESSAIGSLVASGKHPSPFHPPAWLV